MYTTWNTPRGIRLSVRKHSPQFWTEIYLSWKALTSVSPYYVLPTSHLEPRSPVFPIFLACRVVHPMGSSLHQTVPLTPEISTKKRATIQWTSILQDSVKLSPTEIWDHRLPGTQTRFWLMNCGVVHKIFIILQGLSLTYLQYDSCSLPSRALNVQIRVIIFNLQ